jgi:uracil-DNA glycosylase family 4
MTSIMTHPDHSIIEQTRETLRRLRWVLSGHAMSGLQEWHRPSRSPAFSAEAIRTEPRSEDPAQGLTLAREELGDCRRCRLHTSRTQIVFGDGSSAARLVFVGEAPGFEEDRQGRPFVGRAGQLLDKMIQALGLKRSDVYICNVIKCRPPQNRNPQADEVEACAPFLLQQLEAIQPQVICILGTYAAQTLLQTRRPISQLRGKIESWRGIPAVATFHPAYLLRNAAQKASAWQDCRLILQLLRGESPTRRPT